MQILEGTGLKRDVFPSLIHDPITVIQPVKRPFLLAFYRRKK